MRYDTVTTPRSVESNTQIHETRVFIPCRYTGTEWWLVPD